MMRRFPSSARRDRRRGRRALAVHAALGLLAVSAGCGVHRAGVGEVADPVPVHEFHANEHDLRRMRPAGWGGSVTNWSDASAFFDDPTRVLDAVLARAAPAATVLPTERYYYFRLTIPGRRIAGNLRFTDIEDGILHVGYYDLDDPASFRSATFSEGDGVVVRWDEERGVATVRRGASVVAFTIDRSNLDPTPDARPMAGERVISGILDESGYALWLMFDEANAQFFYVLRGDRPLPEPLDRLRTSSTELAVGRRSRFVFARDEAGARWVLVGVSAEQVRRNSFYDGPFDQVPPRLPIRADLERSYPYVTMRGGIDEHGNFRELPGQRVAISPYLQYESIDELLDAADRSARAGVAPWRALVREPKRDFHLRLAGNASPDPPPHRRETSIAWPANHRAAQSRAWPAEHHQASSLRWPPNHETGPSLIQSPP